MRSGLNRKTAINTSGDFLTRTGVVRRSFLFIWKQRTLLLITQQSQVSYLRITRQPTEIFLNIWRHWGLILWCLHATTPRSAAGEYRVFRRNTQLPSSGRMPNGVIIQMIITRRKGEYGNAARSKILTAVCSRIPTSGKGRCLLG